MIRILNTASSGTVSDILGITAGKERRKMDNVEWLADMIYYYPSEVVTKSGCEGLAKYLLENGVTLFPSVPGHDDKYNIAEMAYNNG
jgi:hypothetical protein